MSSKKTINVNFNKAINEAKEMKETAKNMRKIEQELKNTASRLNGSWKSDSAKGYYNKCQILAEKINKNATELEKVSTLIHNTAKAYYQAEMQAIETVHHKS